MKDKRFIFNKITLLVMFLLVGVSVSAQSQSWIERKKIEMESMVRACVNSDEYEIKVVDETNPGKSTVYAVVDPVVIDYERFFLTQFKRYCSDPKRSIDPYHKGTVKVKFDVNENGLFSNAVIVQEGYKKADRIIPILINGSSAVQPGTINGKEAKFTGEFELEYDKWSSASVKWTPVIEIDGN